MSEPRRILHDPSASALSRELLSSFDERPSAASRDATLAALGLGAATLTAASAGAAAAPKASIAIVAAKIVGAVIIAGSVVTGGAMYLHSTLVPPQPVATFTPARAHGRVTPSAQGTVETSPTEIATPAPLDSAAPAPIGTDAHRSTSRAQPAGSSSIDAQIGAIDRARASVESGDPTTALSRIDAYEARFPNGAFTQEAEALRVHALSDRGDAAGARAAAQRFVARYPTSPHRQQVRAWGHLDP